MILLTNLPITDSFCYLYNFKEAQINKNTMLQMISANYCGQE